MLNDYLKLPYTRIIREINDETGHYWYGEIVELRGCHSDGKTREEASNNLDEALAGHLKIMLEDGVSIPIPDNSRYNKLWE